MSTTADLAIAVHLTAPDDGYRHQMRPDDGISPAVIASQIASPACTAARTSHSSREGQNMIAGSSSRAASPRTTAAVCTPTSFRRHLGAISA